MDKTRLRTSDSDRKYVLDLAWWMNPLVPALMVFIVSNVAILTAGNETFAIWRVFKYVSDDVLWLNLSQFLAFISGILLSSVLYSTFRKRRELGREATISLAVPIQRLIDTYAHTLFILVLVAYIVWIMSAAARGVGVDSLLRVVSLEAGAIGEFKRIATPIGGITTLAQVAPVAVVLRMILIAAGLPRRRYEITVIVLLSLVRAFVFAERLALVEVVVPLAIVLIAVQGGSQKWQRRLRIVLHRYAPIVGLVALWLVFSAFEYSRSWQYYSDIEDVSFVSYMNSRLIGYYATSTNNGALYYELIAAYPHDPYFSFSMLWDFPVLGQAMLGRPEIQGFEAREWWSETLQYYANPEFNNIGTLSMVASDLGIIGGGLFWLWWGLFVGSAFESMRRGAVVGLVLYVTAYVGILELVRIPYWTLGRYTPIVVAIVILVFRIRSVGSTVTRLEQSVSGSREGKAESPTFVVDKSMRSS